TWRSLILESRMRPGRGESMAALRGGAQEPEANAWTEAGRGRGRGRGRSLGLAVADFGSWLGFRCRRAPPPPAWRSRGRGSAAAGARRAWPQLAAAPANALKSSGHVATLCPR